MDNKRTAKITVGGEEYALVLTTKATREIAKRYGGLENLGEKLMKAENAELALAEIVWLVCILANQAVLIHNLRCRDEPRELLTEDEIDLLTTPAELTEFKDAIIEAMSKGTKRNIESEDEGKNAQAG